MKQPLTQKQQELVEKNHNLIYEFAKKKNLIVDEYYGILAIGLCNAALIYKEENGKFSTIAYRCMDNILTDHYRHLSRVCGIPEDKVLSYDVNVSDEDSDGTYLDSIADSRSTQDIVISGIVTEELMDMLSDKEKTIVDLLSDGMTQDEVAVKMGCKQQNVSYYVTQIRKKWSKVIDNI